MLTSEAQRICSNRDKEGMKAKTATQALLTSSNVVDYKGKIELPPSATYGTSEVLLVANLDNS